jgi:lactoylglutathione lyase
MFNRINAVVLFVHDFQKCLAFYRDILGLEVVQLESRFAAFKMNEQDFAIIEMSEASEMVKVPMNAFEPQSGKTDRVLLCTRVENVDDAYEALKAKGVEFTMPPTDQYWGLRTAFFKDPEGNLWEIARPLTT